MIFFDSEVLERKRLVILSTNLTGYLTIYPNKIGFKNIEIVELKAGVLIGSKNYLKTPGVC